MSFVDSRADEGISLLFPMNELFEGALATLLRRALSGSEIEVVAQSGLGGWAEQVDCIGHVFQTKPDILLINAAPRFSQ